MSRILRATTENGEVRAFVAETRDLVNRITTMHKTSPVASASLGRTLTAGAMMGAMLKGDKDILTISIKGDGPLGGIMVTANGLNEVRGYVTEPLVDIPRKANGKLDVSGAVGKGKLTVIRDLGLKEPYVGQIDLVSGEIAEDLTYYFAASEQTNSVVALGVLVDKDYSIKQSGGFIIQLLPGASEETISRLEKNIYSIKSVTEMFESGMAAEDILESVLEGLSPKVHQIISPVFKCQCSKEKFENALLTIGQDDMDEIIKAGETIETSCHFCNTQYYFTIDELKKIRVRMDHK